MAAAPSGVGTGGAARSPTLGPSIGPGPSPPLIAAGRGDATPMAASPLRLPLLAPVTVDQIRLHGATLRSCPTPRPALDDTDAAATELRGLAIGRLVLALVVREVVALCHAVRRVRTLGGALAELPVPLVMEAGHTRPPLWPAATGARRLPPLVVATAAATLRTLRAPTLGLPFAREEAVAV